MEFPRRHGARRVSSQIVASATDGIRCGWILHPIQLIRRYRVADSFTTIGRSPLRWLISLTLPLLGATLSLLWSSWLALPTKSSCETADMLLRRDVSQWARFVHSAVPSGLSALTQLRKPAVRAHFAFCNIRSWNQPPLPTIAFRLCTTYNGGRSCCVRLEHSNVAFLRRSQFNP